MLQSVPMSASDMQGLALAKALRPDSSSACTCGHVQDIIDRRNRGWDPDTESNSERRELQMTRSQSSGASQRDTWLTAHLPEQGSPSQPASASLTRYFLVLLVKLCSMAASCLGSLCGAVVPHEAC